MKRSTLHLAVTASVLVVATAASGGLPSPRRLSFEQRVRAQAAIDRVYYSHQSGATRPFEQVVSRDVLERKVRTYLMQSVALEQVWKNPVTAESLSRELERIARDTRHPDWLHEIYAVLHHDAFLVQETFARPILVDRLIRSLFASDDRIHAAARLEAEGLREGLVAGELDPRASHPRRREDQSVRSPLEQMSAATQARPRAGSYGGDLGPVDRQPEPLMCRESRSFDESHVGPVEDEQDAFVIKVATDGGELDGRDVSYSIPKVSWDTWWSGVEPTLRDEGVVPVASAGGPLPVPGTGVVDTGVCIPEDTWDNGILDDPPDPRRNHLAVWTGTEMIVWGPDDSGSRYDPLTDSWRSVPNKSAPSGGWGSYPGSAFWTGQEMLVWNGKTGGAYDPRLDTWRPISSLSAPDADESYFWGEAVWTGQEMIIWSGQAQGGRYDLASNAWKPVSSVGAPAFGSGAVWTGVEMLAEGARYEPASDTWSPLSSVNAPAGHYRPVWTGSALIAVTYVTFDEDPGPWRRYDPGTDSWTALSVPAIQYDRFTAVWTGTEVVVWGGTTDCSCETNTGIRYDPAADRWASTSLTNAPSPRLHHTAVWSGHEMIIWGGGIFGGAGMDDQQFGSGGRYDPETDTWRPTSTTNGGPGPRWGHTAVWTGNFMAVLGAGALYDPLADSWRSISTHGARGGRAAVWTGNEIIVMGGRYDPLADVWRPVSTDGAPVKLVNTAAVWTGREVVVAGFMCNVTSPEVCETGVQGARYDPTTDTWRSMAALDAPFFAWSQLQMMAVWTGREVIIVGDQPPQVISGNGLYGAQAGRYDPATDTWRLLPTYIQMQDQPISQRSNVVWTGKELIILRALSDRVEVDRYDPELDSWTSGSTSAIPLWDSFASVWTGREAIVWGIGGGRYDPVIDTWKPMSAIDAPWPRFSHSAVWTGRAMIVWGGLVPIEPIIPLATGGRYFPDPPPDEDVDGYTSCSGDCDESSPSINPAAVELPGNMIDENCDGAVECNPCSAWKNQGQYVACVARSVRALQGAGLLARDEAHSLMSSAANSDTWRRRSALQVCAP